MSAVVAIVALTVIDPTGLASYAHWLKRFLYWGLKILVALLIARTLRMALPPLHARFGWFVARVCHGVFFSFFMTPVLIALVYLFFPQQLDALPGAWGLGLYVFLVFAAVVLVGEAVYFQFSGRLSRFEETSSSPVIDPTPAPEHAVQDRFAPALGHRLAQKLDPSLGDRILRLEMQDHYVEVHTDKGSQLVLMRLSDAVAELSQLDGLQVHRSHWVARHAVHGQVRQNGKWMLKMEDEALVPVSRSRLQEARDAGYLASSSPPRGAKG